MITSKNGQRPLPTRDQVLTEARLLQTRMSNLVALLEQFNAELHAEVGANPEREDWREGVDDA